MYWYGGLEGNTADWNWVENRDEAKVYSSLAEAQSKAFYIATKYPRYFGHVSVEAVREEQ